MKRRFKEWVEYSKNYIITPNDNREMAEDWEEEREMLFSVIKNIREMNSFKTLDKHIHSQIEFLCEQAEKKK